MYEWDMDNIGDEYTGDSGRKDSFVRPKPGAYLAEVQEGIDLFHNQKTDKHSLRIPLKLVRPVDDERGNGDPSAVGAEVADFISPAYEFTMKRLGFIISCSKYRSAFTKKYAGIPETSDADFAPFLLDLKRHLPSTKVIILLAEATDTKGGGKSFIRVVGYKRLPSSPAPSMPTDGGMGWTADE